jgi:putative transferase (TIGR04331 family)
MFLATTPRREFWDDSDEVIALGKWCFQEPQDADRSFRISGCIKYHWADQEVYRSAAQVVDRLYESCLPLLTGSLNKFHDEDNSVDYWRVIVGPWLYYFIGVVYDRYLSIRSAEEDDRVTHTWLPELKIKNNVPADFDSFQSAITQDDYNFYLFSRIISFLNNIPAIPKRHISFDLFQNSFSTQSNQQKSTIPLRLLYRWYLTNIVYRKNDVFFASPTRSRRDLFFLQLVLGNLPGISAPDWRKFNSKGWEIDREGFNVELFSGPEVFSQLLAVLIAEQTPLCYLEGYAEIKEIARTRYPNKPTVIVSSNQHFINEVFKVWLAGRLGNGAKLVGTPHGGHYGNALFSANEKHERKVAHLYATWGWQDQSDKRARPIPSMLLAKAVREIHVNKKGGVLWIGLSRPRYFNWMVSAPLFYNMDQYVEDQLEIVKNLNQEVKKKFLMRGFHTGYGNEIKKKIAERFPETKFSEEGSTLYNDLCQNTLCVVSYNGTPILEAIAADYPVLAQWDPKVWSIRPAARSIFKKMFDAGIFFYDPKELSKKVNEVYTDPVEWWNSPGVRDAKEVFREEFALTTPGWMKIWREELRTLRKHAHSC